jgi:hypothetical protein
MLLTTLLVLVAQVGSAPSPSATQSTPPLKEIGHVRSSTLCTALRNNLSPAVEGLRINDALVGRGQAILVRTAEDAAAYAASVSPTDPTSAGDPFAQEAGANAGSASATGGGSAGSEMDGFQLGTVSHSLAKNLDKVEAFLDDPHSFPDSPTSDDERALALAKSRLEAVVARQRASLNIISATAEMNAGNDLRSRRDVIPYEHCMTCTQTPPFTPISAPRALAAATNQTQQTENGVAPAVLPIVAACR